MANLTSISFKQTARRHSPRRIVALLMWLLAAGCAAQPATTPAPAAPSATVAAIAAATPSPTDTPQPPAITTPEILFSIDDGGTGDTNPVIPAQVRAELQPLANLAQHLLEERQQFQATTKDASVWWLAVIGENVTDQLVVVPVFANDQLVGAKIVSRSGAEEALGVPVSELAYVVAENGQEVLVAIGVNNQVEGRLVPSADGNPESGLVWEREVSASRLTPMSEEDQKVVIKEGSLIIYGISKFFLGFDFKTEEEIYAELGSQLFWLMLENGQKTAVCLTDQVTTAIASAALSEAQVTAGIMAALEAEHLKLTSQDFVFIMLDPHGQPQAWFTQDPNLVYFEGYVNSDGQVVNFTDDQLTELVVTPHNDAATRRVYMRYDQTRLTMVTANPFQIRYEFQDGEWISRKLPHERKNGQAEYRTPEQIIELLFKDLYHFTFYRQDLDPAKIETAEMTFTLADGSPHRVDYWRVFDKNTGNLYANVVVRDGVPIPIILLRGTASTPEQNPSEQPLTAAQAAAFIEAIARADLIDPSQGILDVQNPSANANYLAGIIDRMLQEANVGLIAAKLDFPDDTYFSSHSEPDGLGQLGWNSIYINPLHFPEDSELSDGATVALVAESLELIGKIYFVADILPPKSGSFFLLMPNVSDSTINTDISVAMRNVFLNALDWIERHKYSIPVDQYLSLKGAFDHNLSQYTKLIKSQ